MAEPKDSIVLEGFDHFFIRKERHVAELIEKWARPLLDGEGSKAETNEKKQKTEKEEKKSKAKEDKKK